MVNLLGLEIRANAVGIMYFFLYSNSGGIIFIK